MAPKRRSAAALADAASSMAEAAASAAESEAVAGASGNGVHFVEDDYEEVLATGPIFSLPADKKSQHTRTRIYRDEPIDEGHLGSIGMDEGEEAILRKWGGGTFHAEAISDKGGFISRKSGIKIAGEPKFTNALAKRKYAAWVKGEFETPGGTDAPAAGGSIAEQVALLDAREKLAEAAHRRELERLKAESEARIKESESREEARQRDAEAREERRQKEADERHTRDMQFLATQHQQQIEFMATNMKQEAKADPMAMLKSMTGIMSDLRDASGGDGSHAPDVATALVENMDKILGAIDGVTGGRDKDKTATKTKTETPGKASNAVALTGDLAEKARAAAKHLARQGVKNPGEALSAHMTRALESVMKISAVKGGKPATKTLAKRPASKGKA